MGLNFWQSLLAVLVGTVAFGPLGTVLAIPVAAVLKLYIDKRNKTVEVNHKAAE